MTSTIFLFLNSRCFKPIKMFLKKLFSFQNTGDVIPMSTVPNIFGAWHRPTTNTVDNDPTIDNKSTTTSLTVSMATMTSTITINTTNKDHLATTSTTTLARITQRRHQLPPPALSSTTQQQQHRQWVDDHLQQHRWKWSATSLPAMPAATVMATTTSNVHNDCLANSDID